MPVPYFIHLHLFVSAPFLFSSILTVFAAGISKPTQIEATPCPNSCSANGKCTTPWGVCTCFDGFTGADCSLRTCPRGKAISDSASANDSAHHEAECSNRGSCNRSTGQCKCENMFEGSACERFMCPNDCSGRGRCVSAKALARLMDPGALRNSCTSTDICKDVDCNERDYSACMSTYTYETWEADNWHGCLCDDGYTGYDCSRRTCAKGDDPLTTGQNNEVQLLECHADFGTFTLSFGRKTTAPISANASVSQVMDAINALSSLDGQHPKVAVSWTVGVDRACIASGNLIQVTFLQNFGDLPLLIPDGKHLGQTSGLETPLITSQKVVTGDKESDVCSMHGTCDEDKGVCNCLDEWTTSDGYGNAGTRGDCGHRESGTTSSCPGEPTCLGHGVCSGPPNYRCECEQGRSGPDCALIDCPVGKSWFSFPIADDTAHDLKTCSDIGLCDHATGQCKCAEGFEGVACQYMTCANDCNGHGECLSMSELAKRNRVNGNLTPFTYGTNPNDPLTWDAYMIYGCECAEGYHGFQCAMRSCPFGDDPHTQHQRNEVQQLYCSDSDNSGSFELTFRDQTATVSVTNTASDLESILNALPTIESVSVSYTDPEIYVGAPSLQTDSLQVCRDVGQSVEIEFLSPTGNVPEIFVTNKHSDIDGILSISTLQTGTKEFIECSGRGLCSTDTGLCQCFHGYGSSDGQGNVGTRDDCGYIVPYSFDS